MQLDAIKTIQLIKEDKNNTQKGLSREHQTEKGKKQKTIKYNLKR